MRPMPCKYFAKGGCKFGRKCALLHVAPDGTVVNNRMYPPAPQYPTGGSMVPNGYGSASPSLLSMQAQGLDQRQNGDMHQEYDGYGHPQRNGREMPQIDMTYASASPKYGSSPQNEGMATSPNSKGLSVLDAPLPSSFDSNGISWMARYGPVAASVPSKFGLESAPSSYPRTQMGGTALRDLHTSVYGGGRGMDNMLASIGSSPPSSAEEPIVFEKRSLHSERLRASRQPLFSTSLGTSLGTRPHPQPFDYPNDDDEDEEDADTDREEDLLPSSLHDLIPDHRARRDSRNRITDDNAQAFLTASRRTISGHGTPQDSKVGSPHSSSPSRFTNMFQRSQNSFGHVGSPLRDTTSSLATAFHSAGTNGVAGNGELSPSVSSPPRQASMSMLTQGLQRAKLDAAVGGAARNSPIRSLSNGSLATVGGSRTSLDRNLSSTSVSQQRIAEEQDAELFDMEGLHELSAKPSPAEGGGGGGLATNPWGAIGSYHPSPTRTAAPTFGPIGGQRSAKEQVAPG